MRAGIRSGRAAVLVLGLSTIASCSTRNLPSTSPSTTTHPSLSTGTYTLILDANFGSKKGASTKGTLRLVESKPDDRSPETGKTPWDQWAHRYPLWGWVEIDLDAVGAPVIPGDGPEPSSRDPITPGVLVYLGSTSDSSSATAPVLLIGTANQTRNPVITPEEHGDIITVSSDGSGIGLKVKKVNAKGFKGTWREYGIIANGRGTFQAVRQYPETGGQE